MSERDDDARRASVMLRGPYRGEAAPLAEIGRIRDAAWAAAATECAWGEAPAPGPSIDGFDARSTTLHWTAELDGALVGTGRLCVAERFDELPDLQTLESPVPDSMAPLAVLGRLVVHPSATRRGVARRLDEARLAHAERIGVGVVFAWHGGWRRSALDRVAEWQRRPIDQTGPWWNLASDTHLAWWVCSWRGGRHGTADE